MHSALFAFTQTLHLSGEVRHRRQREESCQADLGLALSHLTLRVLQKLQVAKRKINRIRYIETATDRKVASEVQALQDECDLEA